MIKNTASQIAAVFAWDSANNAPKTGDAANITAQISKDGGATAATNDTNPTELDATDAKGIYLFDLTQAETNGDLIIISAVSSTASIDLDPVVVYTVRDIEALLPAALVGGRMDSDVAAIQADAITAAAIATDAIDADALATDAAQEIADEILKRGVSNVEDSADATSLAAIILAILESSVAGTTWTIRKTDNTTFVTKTVTVDASANPITGVT